MSVKSYDRPGQLTMRPLTKREIDERIHRLVTEVIAWGDHEHDDDATAAGALRPRWIAASELVQRMSRFLSHN
jgi:hypothetical protein